ncbi:hypothetical protein, partial [Pseudomonas cannabina]|uniref:hypothetical protein n=1 Tax=Pseudomonas cannabina TaxID=86840 RepID=UPI001C812B21
LAAKQARPFGLRAKSRHASLQDLKREQPFSASCAWPGEIWPSNAARDETGTDPGDYPVQVLTSILCSLTITRSL